MVCQMIQTGQSPSKSTFSNLSNIIILYPDIYPQDFDPNVRHFQHSLRAVAESRGVIKFRS